MKAQTVPERLTITADFYTEEDIAVLCGFSLDYVKANRDRRDWAPATRIGDAYFYQKAIADIYIYTHAAYFYDHQISERHNGVSSPRVSGIMSSKTAQPISRGMAVFYDILGAARSTRT